MRVRRSRPFAVLDGTNEEIGSFADWNSAHAWAHTIAGLPGTVVPLEVEDRAQRVTRRITATGCELIAWTIFTRQSGCATSEVEPSILYRVPLGGEEGERR